MGKIGNQLTPKTRSVCWKVDALCGLRYGVGGGAEGELFDLKSRLWISVGSPIVPRLWLLLIEKGRSFFIVRKFAKSFFSFDPAS